MRCTLSSRTGTAGGGDRLEQLVDGFVVDLVRGELLVEIQTGSFAPLRRKLEQLTQGHRVRLVAPVPLVRTIVRLSDEGEPLSARRSPRRGRVEDIFSRLVSIPALLCHPRFELELLPFAEAVDESATGSVNLFFGRSLAFSRLAAGSN